MRPCFVGAIRVLSGFPNSGPILGTTIGSTLHHDGLETLSAGWRRVQRCVRLGLEPRLSLEMLDQRN